jgi:CheY-like chemotaxis protein
MVAAPRIVVIDDNRAWLEALAEYLGRHGFAVQTTEEPARGLALIEKDSFALAVVDVHMPQMDGMEFVRRLRRAQRSVPIILSSSEEEPSLINRALAAGARAFHTKSRPPGLLLGLIHQILKEHSPIPARSTQLPIWQRLLPSPRALRPGAGKRVGRTAKDRRG